MQTQRFIKSDATIYRKIKDELVVVQLDTGRYYFFNTATQSFLESFEAPRSIDEFCAPKQMTEEDRAYLGQFCQFLLESKIFKPTEGAEIQGEPLPSEYEKPEFFRSGEKTIDQISFLCP